MIKESEFGGKRVLNYIYRSPKKLPKNKGIKDKIAKEEESKLPEEANK